MQDYIIKSIEFKEALSERYLAYALSTIMSRSLPDVRDGLKPVHRRLLFAMLQLKLEPKSAYKKCARIVGDVIGKYHPHGDTAVYETLVRLAQNFSLRYPLIEGQGNFGSIDGDNAAAMRYTESRLTEIATYLMADLELDTVDFKPTYDGSESEPTLMPSIFPNLLANGSEGIAVGMATSIPPHNLDELCTALIKLLDDPDLSIETILESVIGPDFPTGGILYDNKATIAQAYKTGRGSFRLRARWERENLSHGQYNIVITEIPYQIQKSKLIEQIATLLKDKKLPLIADIYDESAETVRLIIEPKSRTLEADLIMESLFKATALENRIQLNMNVLGAGSIPKVMNIKEVLSQFLEHRKQIILRRSNFLLEKTKRRLELLAGFRVAYLNLDRLIDIIRNEDEPRAILISEFSLSELQADSILNLRLRSLRRLEEEQIEREYNDLEDEKLELETIIAQPKILAKSIRRELKNLQTKFGAATILGSRRTSFVEASAASIIDISAFIEKEPITIICSKLSWIRAIKGHNHDEATFKYKEGDEAGFILEASTVDKIVIATDSGKFFTLLADRISKGKGQGDSLKLLVDIGPSEIINIFVENLMQKYLLAASHGKGFIVSGADLQAQTKSGKQIMNLADKVLAVKCLAIDGDMAAIIGTNRKLLVLKIADIPELKRGTGIILQRFKEAKLSDIKIFDHKKGLIFGNKRLEKDLTSWLAKPGGSGKIPFPGLPRNNKFA